MEYLLYILAGFGIFSLLVLFLRLIVWCIKCECIDKKKLVPIGESAVYSIKSSLMNVNEKEAIRQFDQMLDEYTKPKVVISRQCICPFCTKETQKIIINDKIDSKEEQNCLSKQILEEFEPKTDESLSDFGDNSTEGDDIILCEESEDMPCNKYNYVVQELKTRFSAQNQTEVKKLYEQDYP